MVAMKVVKKNEVLLIKSVYWANERASERANNQPSMSNGNGGAQEVMAKNPVKCTQMY